MKRKRLTQEAIFKLTHPHSLELRRKIKDVLTCTNTTVLSKISRNDWNGDLTKDAVIELLEDGLKMNKSDILEAELIEVES